jgi:hypothetical protein
MEIHPIWFGTKVVNVLPSCNFGTQDVNVYYKVELVT